MQAEEGVWRVSKHLLGTLQRNIQKQKMLVYGHLVAVDIVVFFCFHFVILVIKHVSYLRNNSWISNAVHAWIGLVDYWLMWVKQKLLDIRIKEK